MGFSAAHLVSSDVWERTGVCFTGNSVCSADTSLLEVSMSPTPNSDVRGASANPPPSARSAPYPAFTLFNSSAVSSFGK
ncbi:unnamed protein product, partial [Dibothriocephalus latus]